MKKGKCKIQKYFQNNYFDGVKIEKNKKNLHFTGRRIEASS